MSTAREAVIMLGKPVADQIEAGLKPAVAEFVAKHKVVPKLGIILVGKSGPSLRYVKRKTDACERLGMAAEIRTFDADIDADALKAEVQKMSDSPDFQGVIVQLPLPRHIEEHESATTNKFDLFDVIAPMKDVDGVGQEAVAQLYRAQTERMMLLPATALAVRRMMAFYGVQTQGKLAVVVGRNDITAKPLVHMLGGRMCNAAAIWCHRYVSPENQRRLISEADILITAVGTASYRITADMLKPGVAIFDVATRVDPDGKMHGDVDFEPVKAVASHITPVPKGVGPVTVAALCENLFRAAQFQAGVGKMGYVF